MRKVVSYIIQSFGVLVGMVGFMLCACESADMKLQIIVTLTGFAVIALGCLICLLGRRCEDVRSR